jgi:crossover junction endonuclease EME1
VKYRTQAESHDTAFCMDAGQIKSGDDPRDTFNKMLQENLRITAPIAYGIMAEYPTVQKLIQGFEENGPMALADCRTSANKDGAFTDRKVGKAISKRLHGVFTGRDPDSWAI